MISDIRALTFDDEEEILDLIQTSIYNGDDIHLAKLSPTQNNVINLFKHEIFPIIFEDDPIFGAFENEKLIGLTCCSTKLNTIYQLQESLALGIITIIHPDYRQQGIGTALRIHNAKVLKKRGIKKFIFEIKENNPASLQNAQKIGKNLNADADLVSFKFEGSTNVF
jgi:GNAT superfamily N-acetyltransferase